MIAADEKDRLEAASSETGYTAPSFPTGLAPEAVDLGNDGTGPLPKVDFVIMAYTYAEGVATSKVLTPGKESPEWTKYTHNFESKFLPELGEDAPARWSKDLASFWGCKVGSKIGLAMKSSLHPDYDGPALPLADLWQQIAEETEAPLLITTGTAGGIGATTLLGDVVVAQNIKWNCAGQFKNAAFAHDSYVTSAADFPHPAQLSYCIQEMLPVNTKRLPNGGSSVIFADDECTDTFAYDCADDRYGLRKFDPAARSVEMDDGALGLAMQRMGGGAPKFLGIRCASDPGNLVGTDAETKKQAEDIYQQWGGVAQYGAAQVSWVYAAEGAS